VSVLYPNGQISTFSWYDNLGDQRLKEIWHKTSGGTTISKFNYGYDALGRITAWTNGLNSEAMAFNYDREDQLLDTRRFPASGGSSPLPQAFSYGYDSAGNRIFEQTEIAPTPSG